MKNGFISSSSLVGSSDWNSILFFLFIVSLFAFSCKKEEADHPTPEIVITLDETGLAYINIPVGKYFIYKDSATSELDSVAVTISSLQRVHIAETNGPDPYNHVPARSYQTFNLVLTKISSGPAEEWLNATLVEPSFIGTADGAAIFLNEKGNLNAFIYPVDYSTGEIHSTIAIEGKIYSDVVETTDDNGLNTDAPHYKKTINLWAKNIGIIKRTVTGGDGLSKVYTLVRNN